MATANPSEPARPRRNVPPPKATYTPPHEEERSEATQIAADRYLTGQPTITPGEAK